MLSKSLGRNYEPRRLLGLLLILFLALAIPTAAVIWQAYDQLKFEAFYQYRNQAEALAERIDADLIADIEQAEARRFTDFAFLNVAGDPSANVLQRSPLSNYPVTADIPGVIGYFQVGANGALSTPLLPGDGTSPEQVGITEEEYALRAALAQEIQRILADNRLVRERPGAGSRIARNEDDAEPARSNLPSAAGPSLEREIPERTDPGRIGGELFEEVAGGFASGSSPATAPESEEKNDSYSEQMFDLLNRSERNIAAPKDPFARDDGDDGPQTESRDVAYVKLRDLKLDEGLQKKSEVLEEQLGESETEPRRQNMKSESATRVRRVEQAVLPAAAPAVSAEELANPDNEPNVRITTFESEVDPYEFSLLDSGHLVLFRKVWRNGQRYIQGLLIDRDVFLNDAAVTAYRSTTLSGMSDLIVAYQDDIVDIARGDRYRAYPDGTGELEGTLLHRAKLSAPFDGLELVFSINRLPPGAGAGVLAWTTVLIAVVFVLAFLALYRLGVSQIRLAGQQQDFVSAVSHELKTPLTSIRMYGEMLKEGWVDEKKRGQYYDYIHDESERLTRLIANVLRLAKISRNEPQLDLRTKTVSELMNLVESKISSQVERSGFRLTLIQDDSAAGATVEIDEDCFAQIMINLVDNAIKFSKNTDIRTIEIGSTLTSHGDVLFAVRDYGPGVRKDQMKKIFTLFYRTESELTRETVGTGIGLAIVHHLTLAMNGKIDVLNRDPGAEFRITFPAAA